MTAGVRILGKLVLVAGSVVLLTAATACTSDSSEETVQRLEEQVANLEQRLTEAELQPAPEASRDSDRNLEERLGDLANEITALEVQLGVVRDMITEASPVTDSSGMPERLFALEQKLEALGNPVPTPTHESMAMGTPIPTPEATMMVPATTQEATPTVEAIAAVPNIQEIGIIENYAATQFYPQNMVVLKDIPVIMYLTRLHREHVNRFTISPFYSSSAVILPGEIGVIEFLPDQAGEFKIRNVGHNFEATLVVVETEEERKEIIAARGRQMYALIHSVDDFQIFPSQLVIQEGIPTTIFNIGIIAEHEVSFEPFHTPQGLNVRPREITPIDFTPDETGEFTIRHELHGFTGQLIVEGR